MADTTIVNPPAGAASGLTKEDVQGMINSSMKPIVDATSDLKTGIAAIADSLKAKATEDEGAKAKKPEPLTAEAVGKIVADQFSALTKGQEANAQRSAYMGDKLKDLPAIYAAKLGQDPTKWAQEEQSIREQFKADQKSMGVEPKQLGNANNEGGTTADKQPVDRSKMSAMDLLNSDAKK